MPKAVKAPYPGFIEPSHPEASAEVPAGAAWIYEIKHDGYRGQAHIHDGQVRIYTRTGNDWTDRLPAVQEALQSLKVESIIMDGELAVLNPDTGHTDFLMMQNANGKDSEHAKDLLYFGFDLLYLNGEDLRGLPLIERKMRLKQVLESADGRLRYLEHLEDGGKEEFERTLAENLEGVVAKNRNAPYQSGRNDNWLKIKCRVSETYPIIAFIERLQAPKDAPEIAALYIGRYNKKNELVYAGKVPTGFSNAARRELRDVLGPHIISESPLAYPRKRPMTKATWVKPVVLAEININSTNSDGTVRAASYKGLRPELMEAPPVAPAQPAAKQTPIPGAIAPAQSDLAAYWRRVAGEALPYIAGRPLALVRQENGAVFYHRGPFSRVPPSVHQLPIKDSTGKDTVRLWIDSAEGLQGLVGMGTVEIHPWNAKVGNIEAADQIVFDLDPGPGIEWPFIAQTALQIRDIFNARGLTSWPKVTGSKGVHVTVPLDTPMPHDEARQFARALCESLAAGDPDRLTVSSSKAERPGRIYLDYMRNGRGTTAAAAWTPRALPGAPIAAPISWKQIEDGQVRANSYTIADFSNRL